MQVTGPLVRFKIIPLFIFLIVFSNLSYSQKFPDKLVHNLLKQGIQNIVNQKFDEAKINFKQLDKIHKDLPLGKIYLAATEIAESFDYEKPYDHTLITKYLEDAKKISKRRIQEDKNDIWNNYFIALAEGYSAYYEALNGNWLSAFSDGLNSVSAFDKCLTIDENFYESLIAIGTYKFWRSKKIEFIDWLPFINDEKEIGIDLLKRASQYSDYNSYLAVHSLIWIYIEQKDFLEAAKLAEKALNDYPQSRIFKWGLARAYEEIDSDKAVKIYKEILSSYPQSLKSNKVNVVTLKHLIAQQLVKLKMYDEAIQLCDEILSINGFSDFERERLGNRIDRVRELKASLSLK